MKSKFYLLFVVGLMVSKIGLGHTDSLKFIKYTKIIIGGFIPTETEITYNTTGKIIENYKIPGVSAGVFFDFERKNFLYSIGINHRKHTTGYQFIIKKEDLEGFYTADFDIDGKATDYFYGIWSIPVKFSYQTKFNKANQRFWINIGAEINSIVSGELRTGFGISDANLVSREIVRLNTVSNTKNSNALIYPTINSGIGMSNKLRNGDLLNFGFLINVSNQNIIKGIYTVNLKDRVSTGNYRDSGTYIGFNMGYSFKKNKIKYK